jgi:hypothetical protein
MGTQRHDELVEIALDHGLELVQRELDAVIGDAVLRVVVGANLLLRSAEPTMPRRSALIASLLSLLDLEQALRRTFIAAPCS